MSATTLKLHIPLEHCVYICLMCLKAMLLIQNCTQNDAINISLDPRLRNKANNDVIVLPLEEAVLIRSADCNH